MHVSERNAEINNYPDENSLKRLKEYHEEVIYSSDYEISGVKA